MQIKVETKKLLAAVKAAARFTGKQPATYRFLRLAAAGTSGMEIHANGDFGQARVQLEAACGEDGEAYVDAKMLLNMLSTVTQEAVQIVMAKGNRLVLKADKNSYRLAALPDGAALPPSYQHKLDRGAARVDPRGLDLRAALEFVLHAAAPADVRVYLNGVHLVLEGDKLTLVATDGHRMAVTELALEPLPGGRARPAQPVSCILPRDSVASLLQAVHWAGPLRFSFSAEAFELADDAGFSFTGKVVDFKYPDWQRVIPSGGIYSSVELTDLYAAVARAVILQADRPTAWMRLEDAGRGAGMRVSFDVENLGMDELLQTGAADEPAMATLNPRYLDDALSAMGDAPGKLVLNPTPEGPLKLETARGQPYPYRLCLVMGCRP